MTEITVVKKDKVGTMPPEEKLGFGEHFTDHMFTMDYDVKNGWNNPRVIPYDQFCIFPAAMALHYGQAIFEGIKAFKTADNRVVIFRPKDHFERFNNSADALCIPRIDVDLVTEGLKKVIEVDKQWVPGAVGTALYIRPLIIATDPYVGVKVSDTYKLFIILSPVGAYYAAGFNPVNIKVEDKYVRATLGGLGEAKTPANYAMSLKAQVEAKKEGFAQVLWLDAVERKYIEEVGTMNIFFKINGEIITPALVGSILSGMTRRTVIELAKNWGLKVSERRITIDEVFAAYEKGQLEEVFGTGTAAVISPVGELSWKGKKMVINNNKTGEFSQKLFDTVTGIQYGKLEDKFGWLQEVTTL